MSLDSLVRMRYGFGCLDVLGWGLCLGVDGKVVFLSCAFISYLCVRGEGLLHLRFSYSHIPTLLD